MAMQWWEQEGLDLEGIWVAARKAEKMEGAEDIDRTNTAMDD